MPPWRLIASPPMPAAAALARADAVLGALGPDDPPVAMWTLVDAPALVVGRTAGPPPVDPAAARAAGIPVVRRASGGGPVLWDRALVALDVALPRGHSLAPDDVIATYRWLGEALAAALVALGVPARAVPVAEARAAPRDAAAAACFGGLSPHEVVGPDGRKLAGLSQVRRQQGVLLQAGLPLAFDAAALARLMAPPLSPALLAARAAGLREWTPGLGAPEVVGAVQRALRARLDADLVRGPLRPAEARAAAALAAGRFAPIAWPNATAQEGCGAPTA